MEVIAAEIPVFGSQQGNEKIASNISSIISSTATYFSLSDVTMFRETTLKFPPSAPSNGMNSEYQITPISVLVPCSDAPIQENVVLVSEKKKQQYEMIIKANATAFHKVLLLL